MSVKKILLLGAAGIAAVSMTAAMAGGYTQEPAAPAADNGYYIEGHLGYARQDYFDDVRWVASTGVHAVDHNNARGGFAAGADVGYRINRHFGVELGWYHLPDVNVIATGASAQYFKSWALYLAGKYIVPLAWMNDTDWFFKLGAAYRKDTVPVGAVNSTNGGITTGKATYVRPMFATGLDYSFSDAWSGIVQYTHFSGARKAFPYAIANTGSLGTVAANIFTLGLGYKFTV